MARKALIVDSLPDVWGDRWDVREYRHTDHGFAVALGWPASMPRGRGGSGGPKVIVSDPLLTYLHRHRRHPTTMTLPIGATAIKRLRRLLGLSSQVAAAEWWQTRIVDLADMTVSDFAAKHGVSTGAASLARSAFLGPRIRPAGWWQAPDVALIINSDLPRAQVADELDISIGAVGRMRWMLRTARARREALKSRPTAPEP